MLLLSIQMRLVQQVAHPRDRYCCDDRHRGAHAFLIALMYKTCMWHHSFLYPPCRSSLSSTSPKPVMMSHTQSFCPTMRSEQQATLRSTQHVHTRMLMRTPVITCFILTPLFWCATQRSVMAAQPSTGRVIGQRSRWPSTVGSLLAHVATQCDAICGRAHGRPDIPQRGRDPRRASQTVPLPWPFRLLRAAAPAALQAADRATLSASSPPPPGWPSGGP
mmetsp:Transcript_35691/g.77899  ORF Transcript_35691/g.77899 Transcript_35691/m.77899 type:complete len:219 (-) Transcript_35691:232-888(-)